MATSTDDADDARALVSLKEYAGQRAVGEALTAVDDAVLISYEDQLTLANAATLREFFVAASRCKATWILQRAHVARIFTAEMSIDLFCATFDPWFLEDLLLTTADVAKFVTALKGVDSPDFIPGISYLLGQKSGVDDVLELELVRHAYRVAYARVSQKNETWRKCALDSKFFVTDTDLVNLNEALHVLVDYRAKVGAEKFRTSVVETGDHNPWWTSRVAMLMGTTGLVIGPARR
jgi:hypothetical protein